MSVCIETYKQVNLVEFLAEHYGLKFKRSGSGYVAGSPFGADKTPSFFVRQLGGRWLFKDFSSGLGGSIIDLVGHLEHLSGVGNIRFGATKIPMNCCSPGAGSDVCRRRRSLRFTGLSSTVITEVNWLGSGVWIVPTCTLSFVTWKNW